MSDAQRTWEEYKDRELAKVVPALKELGYSLDTEQPHLLGERHLMQAVTTVSGKKLILLGRHAPSGKRAVIKATSDAAGAQELRHERKCRRVLGEIGFAYDVFLSPEELFFGERAGHTISIQAFIEQERAFVERPAQEQFRLALKAFKAQESAHATTYRHLRTIQNTFDSAGAQRYIDLFKTFGSTKEALEFLHANRDTIEQYCGFLTHTDFVPHNIRVKEGNMYLLDHSSLRFGNKYEGWARFINFMELYNPTLASWLVEYVRDNRTPEESLSLKLMRVYRLGEIIHYYRAAAAKSSGDLKALNEKRVVFWSDILDCVLHDRQAPSELVESYKQKRDSLRSEDEKRRQIGLH